jgi:hypothetical protein
VLLQRILGKDLPPYLSANLGVDRPSTDEISAETRALIIERNRLDAELYRFALELFEEELLASVDEDFAAEVESLRAESAAANERATQKALEWVDRELPADSSKPKSGLATEARAAGIPTPALKHVLDRLSVAQELNDAGQVIYCRPSD